MKNERKKLLYPFGYVVLLLAYVFANTHLPFFHHHDHHQVDEFVSHDHDVHENDACHNFVFHGAELQECPHPGHVHESENECLTCQGFLPAKFIMAHSVATLASTIPAHSKVFTYSFEVLKTKTHAFFLRGPPQTV